MATIPARNDPRGHPDYFRPRIQLRRPAKPVRADWNHYPERSQGWCHAEFVALRRGRAIGSGSRYLSAVGLHVRAPFRRPGRDAQRGSTSDPVRQRQRAYPSTSAARPAPMFSPGRDSRRRPTRLARCKSAGYPHIFLSRFPASIRRLLTQSKKSPEVTGSPVGRLFNSSRA